MKDRPVLILTQKPAHPANAFALHDVVHVSPALQVRHVRDMPADDDRGARLVLSDQAAHAPDLEDVRHDRADADDVVLTHLQLFDKPLLGRKIEEGTRGLDVHLDQHQPPRPMKRAQREGVLHSRYLIVIQLHRVDQAAAVLIVTRVRAEYARQKHPRLRAERMNRLVAGSRCHESPPFFCSAWQFLKVRRIVTIAVK